MSGRLHGALAWIGVMIAGLLAAGLFAVAVVPGQSPGTRLAAGVVAVMLAVFVAAGVVAKLALRGRAVWLRSTLGGAPAVFVPYRLARFVPAVTTLVLAVLGLLAATIAFFVGGYGTAGVILALITAYVFAGLLAFVVAQRSRPGVVVSEDALELRSLQRRTRVPWREILAIETHHTTARPTIDVVVRVGAPGVEIQTRRLPIRLESRGIDDVAEIEGSWIGVDWPDLELVLRAVRDDVEARRELIASGGPAHAL